MSSYYVGLDVHSRQSTFAIQDEEGKLIAQGAVPTTPAGLARLQAQRALPAGTRVALETGTVAFFVARCLAALGLEPIVVDAHEVRLKAHRPNQKSDRRDALELCEGLRRDIYRAVVHVPTREIGELRAQLSRRRHFVRLRTAEVNAVKGLLRGLGLGQLSRSLRTEAAWTKLVAALPETMELRPLVYLHRTLWRSAGEQVAALDQALDRQRKGPFQADVRRLETIPGVGPVVALTAVAVFSDIGRFAGAKHAASYAGLVPSTYSSGEREAYGRITKRGSAELRAMLCEAAHHARRPNHPLNPYFAKLCAKRGYKMAAVAVAHRLCRIMFAMLRHQTDFDIGHLGIDVGRFERTSARTYRLKATKAASA